MTRRKYNPDNQQSLPFRKQNGGMWATVGILEKRMILGVAALIVVFSIAYIYFVMSSVMHVAARETLSIEATKRSSQVARLEAEYLKRTESITESFAREHGFVAISGQSFVEQNNAFSLNNPR